MDPNYANRRAAIEMGKSAFSEKLTDSGVGTFSPQMRMRGDRKWEGDSVIFEEALEGAINAGIEAAMRSDGERKRLRQIDG